ncbi:MAG TPA: amidase family protein, partial [Acidobacteriota bacterium]|nr:amidase family protein [Acidobacteriota bacterium]
GKAIRERLADVELVLDMAGECRHAASRADLFGFKPSYGLISRFGVIGLIPSMESCGILSENIREIRTVLKVISGPDERDFSLPDKTPIDFSPVSIKPETTTIGIIREAISGLPESRAKRFRYAVDRFIKLGFPVKELALPDYGFFPLAHHIIGSVEASSCAGRYDSVRYGRRVPGAKNWNEMYLRSRGEAFGPLLKSYLLQGAFFQFERYESFENACRIRARLAGGMKHLFEHCDVMLFPELVHAYEEESVPPALPDLYSLMEMTLFANVTGQPALCLRNDDDSEFSGLQLAGARLDDARLLSLGEYIAAVGRGGNG